MNACDLFKLFTVGCWTSLLATSCIALPGCEPPESRIAQTIQQTVTATNLSILRQVDWKSVMTNMHGRVGPDFNMVAEAYTKSSAGFELRVRGGEIEINTQASGTGGRDNAEAWPEIVAAQTWWEHEVSLGRADHRALERKVADAIIAHEAAKAAASQPAASVEVVPASP